jgi:hypothetical protein
MKAIATQLAGKTIRTLCGHDVMVAYKSEDGETLCIERLLNLDGLYGAITVCGTLYKRTKEELDAHLRFVFDVKRVEIVRQTLVA